MNIETLKEQSKEFQIKENVLNKRETGRLDFIERFPEENICNMSLEEYCLGNGEDTFCYWLEFKNILFGVGGGNASKHGLYKSSKDNCYYTGHAGNKKKLEGNELEEHFHELQKAIITSLELVKNNKIEEVLKIEFPMWNMMMLKILCIYYPDKFLTIGSSKVLIQFAHDIALTGCELKEKNLILINHLLRKKFNDEINASWDYEQIGAFIWDTYKDIVNINYWVIAPGDGARLWDDCKERGVIRIGWDDIVKDLTGLTEDEINKVYVETYPASNKTRDMQLINFCLNMKPGDVIFAKRGRSEILGMGEIRSELKYDSTQHEFRHYRDVYWEKTGKWRLTAEMKKLSAQTLNNANTRSQELLTLLKDKQDKKNNLKLNSILYGPPGTGKTYHTVNLAVAICTGEDIEIVANKTRETVQKQFKELQKDNQIVFSTFHQSMSYEDFVEGIKPESTGEGDISYSVMPGIFTDICNKARANWENSILEQPIAFEDLWLSFIKPLFDDETDNIEIPTARGSYKIYDISAGGTIRFEKQNGSKVHSLALKTLKRLYFDRDAMKKMGGLAMYYSKLIDALDKVKVDSKPKETLKPFVLIIDEINRGNVSAILGELITLIEDDKRLGAKNELRVTLPYSKDDDFGVPPNLYIIGTMNTADRSVEALDTALRRRFIFEEMMPNPTLLEDHNNIDGINLPKMLAAINDRLELLIGRDHTIGHAFFMNLTSLDQLVSVFHNKVIPQLQEYFYGNWSTINLILGDSFVSLKEQNQNNIWPKSVSANKDDFEVREIWEVTKPEDWDAEAFQSIYANVAK